MNPSRRRKKRPNYGLRTVDVVRGPSGFGFTISGQQPCILSCIVNNSPAEQAGLRAGDFLIAVSGVSVSKMAHDAVVNLIGNCASPIQMTIAENYFSDSSDEEFDCRPMASNRRPRFLHRPRAHKKIHHNKISATRSNHGCQANVMKMRECLVKRIEPVLNANLYNEGEQSEVSFEDSHFINSPADDGPIEYKVVVGYLGTIEMPKQLPPNSRLQIVCNCIRILKQEKRSPTPVLMTVLPTCLTLKNASNHILAIYPTNRIVYVGTTIDRETRHFGLVTSVINDVQNDNANSPNEGVEISNSCHVFVTDKKIIHHNSHLEVADSFSVTCTIDPLTGMCLEFPRSAFYIIDLVQNMYKLQCHNPVPLVANSPHPSASSNSDSGIGFRDDCDNISDRILVVEFPNSNTRRDANKIVQSPNSYKRPQGVDGSDISLDALGVPSKRCSNDNFQLNNVRCRTSKCNTENFADIKQVNNLNNIRALDNKDKQESPQKENNIVKEYNKLSCRALLDTSKDPFRDNFVLSTVHTNLSIIGSGIKETKSDKGKSPEIIVHKADSTPDLIDTPSRSKFRIPHSGKKKKKKLLKVAKSCECLDKEGEEKDNFWDKGTAMEPFEKYGCGSLQDLSGWSDHVELKDNKMANVAQSEPDVRLLCGQNVPKSWAKSFEKLLEDPVGINAFAEFLKKEFSAENIYFWTACQRYAHMSANSRRKAEAQRIFHQHLEVGAPEAVNVDAKGRQAAQQELTEAEETCFKLAEQQIFNLMKFDSYSRFLKSTLYQQCLNKEIDFSNLDPRLSVTPINSLTPTRKLQKSHSNAEDGRRKSLLPWHRKNNHHRPKGKERERSESQHHLLGADLADNQNGHMRSSQSSLSSLDFALSYQDLHIGQNQNSSHSRKALCRVRLGDNSTAVVQIKEDETIQQMVQRVLEKRGLVYASFEVFTDKHPKALDISEPSVKLGGCEARVEQRVVFKLDLPNRKIIAVKSKYSKIIVDVLKPILHKYKYSLEEVMVTRGGCPLDVSLPVTEISGEKLHVTLRGAGSEIERKINNSCNTNNFGSHSLRLDNVQATKLKEITNKVFEDILQEKSDFETVKPSKSDKGSVKSEDWGSEHSSFGLLGKFLRRDSAIHEKKKKLIKSVVANKEETSSEHLNKRPLIAKLKAGPCKEVVRSDSDELVEGLTRAQRRLEDQRGTEINFELPDFLKSKQEESSQTLSHLAEINSRLSDISNTSSDPKSPTSPDKNLTNYENYNVEVGSSISPKSVKSEPCSPAKLLVTNRSRNNSESINPRNLEPPPLPPKPKVIPIKPSNWGHSDILKGREAKNVFLDQPSSSFV